MLIVFLIGWGVLFFFPRYFLMPVFLILLGALSFPLWAVGDLLGALVFPAVFAVIGVPIVAMRKANERAQERLADAETARTLAQERMRQRLNETPR